MPSENALKEFDEIENEVKFYENLKRVSDWINDGCPEPDEKELYHIRERLYYALLPYIKQREAEAGHEISSLSELDEYILESWPKAFGKPKELKKLFYSHNDARIRRMLSGEWTRDTGKKRRSNKELAVAVPMSGKQDPVETCAYVLMRFENVEDKRVSRLTAFDSFVYAAMWKLYKNGERVITATRIFHAMPWNNGKKPNGAQTKRILASVEKMMSVVFQFNNEEEKRYGRCIIGMKSTANMLSATIDKFPAPHMVNGAATDNAVLFGRVPGFKTPLPLFEIAEASERLYECPDYLFPSGRMTDNQLAIFDFILYRVKRMKADKAMERSINTRRMAESLGIQDTQKRVDEYTEKVLKHFQDVGHITGYRSYKNGFTVSPKKRLDIALKNK